jgi:hypothetical protein
MIKKITAILFLFFLLNQFSYSQGFDWQYSPRLPFETPNLFIGVDLFSTYNMNSSDFVICEKDIVCDTFNKGAGIGYSAGLKLESWTSAVFSYFVCANYLYIPGKFIKENNFVYNPDVGDKVLEYEYFYSQYSIGAEIGCKYRMNFILPHLFSGISIRGLYQINAKDEFILRKVSEADWINQEIYFTDFDGPEFSEFILMPELKLGYDLNMGLGSYSSLYLAAGVPLYSYISKSDGSLRRWAFSAGISYFPFGIRN